MRSILLVMALTTFAPAAALAHPGSSIAIDRAGRVIFVDTGSGVWRVLPDNSLQRIPGPAYHWFAIDDSNRFAGFSTRVPGGEITVAGESPAVVLSSDFPITIGADGALYYPVSAAGGRIEIIRQTRHGREVYVTLPASTGGRPLRWLNALAAASDGSLYYSEDDAVRKIGRDRNVTTVAKEVRIAACPSIPEVTAEMKPYLRGLAVADDGTVYVAATGCAAVARISSRGEISTLYAVRPPWSPTAVAIRGDQLYVLEYLHTPGDERREWIPRVRQLPRNARSSRIVATIRR